MRMSKLFSALLTKLTGWNTVFSSSFVVELISFPITYLTTTHCNNEIVLASRMVTGAIRDVGDEAKDSIWYMKLHSDDL